MGEIFTACAKITSTINDGEYHLRPESRSVPLSMIMKKAWVEYYPCGVVGMIVPSSMCCCLFVFNCLRLSLFECFGHHCHCPIFWQCCSVQTIRMEHMVRCTRF